MTRQADIVLINPGDRRQTYQGLGAELAAVEPPFWVAVLAAYLRNQGVKVAIIDANGENIPPEETARRAAQLKPLLCCVVVYGSQPSASTHNMTIAGAICRALRRERAGRVALAGLHPSALPQRTLAEEEVDFVIQGEGADALLALARQLAGATPDLALVPGLWYRSDDGMRSNPPAPLVEDLDSYLPVAAWDLLPMHAYRAHNWHCFDQISARSPYGAIYTSLGCPFNCVFCCINAPFGKPGIRYRSPERVVDEMELLVREHGVKNLKIVDELFVLKEDHYLSIVEGIIARKLDLNIWAYARVDTVKPANLKRMKEAGINWLALGIESASAEVRDGADKRMQPRDIKEVVRAIQDAGIRVIGNFIFGLPEDSVETMEETLKLAQELNCEFINFYCAMAYPGSKLYDLALAQGWQLPSAWHDFSQHGYNLLPLPTQTLTAAQVLKFRDDAFHRYFAEPAYLEMVQAQFGAEVRDHLVRMSETRLKRKLLGE
jgi:anaerobic magnesium-protoporphyrin IX monomethyl ester cyclase